MKFDNRARTGIVEGILEDLRYGPHGHPLIKNLQEVVIAQAVSELPPLAFNLYKEHPHLLATKYLAGDLFKVHVPNVDYEPSTTMIDWARRKRQDIQEYVEQVKALATLLSDILRYVYSFDEFRNCYPGFAVYVENCKDDDTASDVRIKIRSESLTGSLESLGWEARRGLDGSEQNN